MHILQTCSVELQTEDSGKKEMMFYLSSTYRSALQGWRLRNFVLPGFGEREDSARSRSEVPLKSYFILNIHANLAFVWLYGRAVFILK